MLRSPSYAEARRVLRGWRGQLAARLLDAGHDVLHPARREALEIRDQVRELQEGHLGIGGHDRTAVRTDVARAIHEDRIRIEDRLDEVLGGVVRAHARQIGTHPLLARPGGEGLALDGVAGGAAEVDEQPPAGHDVAGRRREAPARRHATRAVEGVHRDPHGSAAGTPDRSGRRCPAT